MADNFKKENILDQITNKEFSMKAVGCFLNLENISVNISEYTVDDFYDFAYYVSIITGSFIREEVFYDNRRNKYKRIILIGNNKIVELFNKCNFTIINNNYVYNSNYNDMANLVDLIVRTHCNNDLTKNGFYNLSKSFNNPSNIQQTENTTEQQKKITQTQQTENTTEQQKTQSSKQTSFTKLPNVLKTAAKNIVKAFGNQKKRIRIK